MAAEWSDVSGTQSARLPRSQAAYNPLVVHVDLKLIFFRTVVLGCRGPSPFLPLDPLGVSDPAVLASGSWGGYAFYGPSVVGPLSCGEYVWSPEDFMLIFINSIQACAFGERGVDLGKFLLPSFGNWFLCLELDWALGLLTFSSLFFLSTVLEYEVLFPGARQGNESLTFFASLGRYLHFPIQHTVLSSPDLGAQIINACPFAVGVGKIFISEKPTVLTT